MTTTADAVEELVQDIVADTGRPTTVEESMALWATLGRLGLTRVGIDEDRNGSGGDLGNLLSVIESLGRHAVSAPIAESAAADWLLSRTRDLTSALTTIATLEAAPESTNGTVSATLHSVPWARVADAVVVCPPVDEGGAAFVVDLDHRTATVEPGENLADEPFDDIVLDRTPVTFLTEPPSSDVIARRLELQRLTQLHGASQGAFELTKTYVSHRQQFGQPLVKLPAVASGLAVMRVHIVQSDAALRRAAETVEDRAEDEQSALRAIASVAAARVVVASASTEIARVAHQLHGAIGITWEYELHHFTRRIWSWRDHGVRASDAAALLGRLSTSHGENVMWEYLTH